MESMNHFCALKGRIHSVRLSCANLFKFLPDGMVMCNIAVLVLEITR